MVHAVILLISTAAAITGTSGFCILALSPLARGISLVRLLRTRGALTLPFFTGTVG
jgi:hypothetical protein